MTGDVVAFATDGLSRRDLELLEAFCARRRAERPDAPLYLAVRELPPENASGGPGESRAVRHAALTDRPESPRGPERAARTRLLVDRADNLYRVRRWNGLARRMETLSSGRGLKAALAGVPEDANR